MTKVKTLLGAMMMERPPTRREELASAVSHGGGLLLAVGLVLPAVLLSGWRSGNVIQLAGELIFGLSLCALYATSTMYHLQTVGTRKRYWRLLDHVAIYVLIAGTYTPFALGALRGWLGWLVFLAVWACAFAGAFLKLRIGFRRPFISTSLYLAMGWLVLLILHPLVVSIGWVGFGWLAAGGLFYSLGVVFYLWEQMRYSHVWWHFFVMAGSACHVVAVLGYAGGSLS